MHYAESPAPSAAGDSRQVAESQWVAWHGFVEGKVTWRIHIVYDLHRWQGHMLRRRQVYM